MGSRAVGEDFLPWEVEMIKVIPVSEGQVEDLLTWPLTLDGNYSVRSAYHMLMAEVSSQEPSTSSMEDLQQVWRFGLLTEFSILYGMLLVTLCQQN